MISNVLMVIKIIIINYKMYSLLKNQNKVKTLNLLTQPQFGLRTRVPREINHSFEKDRKEFKLKMTEMRKEHKEVFWQTQTQVENQHFENYRKERTAK